VSGGEVERVGGEVERVPVEPADQRQTIYATVTGWRVAERRPIVPAWVRSRDDRRAFAAWLATHGAYVLGFHASRSPLYLARLTWRAPVGAYRVAGRVAGWLADREEAPLRADTIRRGDVQAYMPLQRSRDRRLRQRGITLAVAAAAVALVGWLAALWVPGWAVWLAAVVGVLVLGKVGTPPDRRVLDPVLTTPTTPPKLTPDAVTRALQALGLAAMSAKDAAITYPAPITRDGPGWRADVDLPLGVTPGDVMERRDRLASAIRRPLGCVWPEPASHVHGGRLVLWVGDQDLAKTKQPAWPLRRQGEVDLFKPLPFGTDQRGRTVAVTLMFASMVIGSVPRMGKTFSLRLLLLAAALDVRAELHLYDLKGTGDLSPLAPVAHAYRAGDDDKDIAWALVDMRALHRELRRRTRTIRGLPRDVCPENKITPELASRRSLGLHPVVLGVDECQRWFEHPVHGGEFTAIAEDLVRRGPAAGIMAIFATQRPDAKSIPTGISGNAVLRFCLKVMDQVANDQVLGTSSYKIGRRATIFTRKDLGIGWLSGEDDEPQITRTFYVDSPGAEAVVTRARRLREAAGTLTGYAAGEDLAQQAGHDLLGDVRAALTAAGTERLWHDDLLARLQELRPGVYDGWDVRRLGAQLRARGVPTRQVAEDLDGERVNRRGVRLDDLAKALGDGDEAPETER
jgi:S-DNA-T family DNA segregation ATPase FtsK/SpoIIIE